MRVGVAGLGRAFMLTLPALVGDRRVELVAAADPRPEARERFASEFGAPAYASVEELCADVAVEVVYVATPHELHAQHAIMASRSGKHALVEKPMAVTLDDCVAMVAAAEAARVTLMVGHSHSFDRPVTRTRELIDSSEFGSLRMIQAQYYTDFLYRPRRPEELATERGGGVVFSQAAHQVDVVRLLAGGRVRSVRALTGAWDRERPTEGAYVALLQFEQGVIASLNYSGYAHFDSDELCAGISELGTLKPVSHYGSARRNLARLDARDEAAEKAGRGYGGRDAARGSAQQKNERTWHEHFGVVIASCDRADLRPLPTGVMVYGDDAAHMEALDRPAIPRSTVIDELYAAVVDGVPALHDGRWGMATQEVCLAILRSARDGRDVQMSHQVAASR